MVFGFDLERCILKIDDIEKPLSFRMWRMTLYCRRSSTVEEVWVRAVLKYVEPALRLYLPCVLDVGGVILYLRRGGIFVYLVKYVIWLLSSLIFRIYMKKTQWENMKIVCNVHWKVECWLKYWLERTILRSQYSSQHSNQCYSQHSRQYFPV